MSRLLSDKISRSTARIGVIGLGYVGLPLVELFAGRGFPVLGLDIDTSKVERLEAGQSYIGHIPGERVRSLRDGGRFEATADFSRLAEVDAVLICVPTPLGKHREPDLSAVVATGRAIGRYLRPGQLVVLESTTYPGTTRDVLRPELEAGGLAAGRDFFLAYSPEREDPGNPQFSAGSIPKVVGGFDPASAELAGALYGAVVPEVVPVSSCEVAEACKILENTYRAVNIALVNELKVVFARMGIDVWEVIDAAKTKPFGFQAFYPGPGLGGHCLAGRETARVHDLGRGLDTVLPLAELFERYRGTGPSFRLGDVEVVEAPTLEVLSIDPETGASGWRPASYLFRRRFRGTMVEVRMAGNHVLRTTDRHPMLVVDRGRLVVREACHLRPGDLVPRFDGLATPAPRPAVDPCIDLLEALPARLVDRLRVRLQDAPWGCHERALKARYGWAIRDAIRRDSLAARSYLELEGELGLDRDRVLLLHGRGSSHSSFPARLRITPEFARLLGYYLSEGRITEERGNPRVRFTFHRAELSLIGDVRAILESLGVAASVHHDKTWEATTVRAGSSLLGYVLRDVLEAGINSRTTRIPAVVMGAPPGHHEQVLSDLSRGDGDVDVHVGVRRYRKNGREYTHQFNSGAVGCFSSSPELLSQVETLLHGLGLHPTRKKGRPQFRLSGSEPLRRIAPWLAGDKADRLKRLDAARLRPLPPRAVPAWSSGQLLTVAGVSSGPADEMVYSIEVPGTHTFATTGDIFVHNCIPIDPFYLTWAAHTYGLHTRFIELAGEINTAMPHHVVERVAAALNDRGKAVKGSRVLVLGAAYKPNVDDCRESPAVELMELLQDRGAEVSYADPHVPALPPLRGHSVRLRSVAPTPETLAAQDCVLVATDHDAFDWPTIAEHASLLIDTRGVTRKHGLHGGRATIVRA